MTNIKILDDRIIFDGHADTRQECETITLMCDSLAQSKDFKTLRYESGYAEFEKMGATDELMFASAALPLLIYFDDHVTSVTAQAGTVDDSGQIITYGDILATWTESGQDGAPITPANLVMKVYMTEGYVIDTVVSSGNAETSVTTTPLDDVFLLSQAGGVYPDDQIVTITTKQGTITPTTKQHIDVSFLSGWNGIESGDHSITIKAQASGYADSDPSNAVVINKTTPAETKTLNESSWAEIAAASKDGTASSKWSIGDEKTITLSTDEEVVLQILGFNHDDLADGSGKAGITFGMKNLLTETLYGGYVTNSGGWATSTVRNSTGYLKAYYSHMPSDLQAVIKEVLKTPLSGGTSTEVVYSIDKLFLFARVDIDGTTETGYASEGTQYEYWQTHNTNADRIKKVKGVGSAKYWWLRSTDFTTSKIYCISTTGAVTTATASNDYGFCFGFCV